MAYVSVIAQINRNGGMWNMLHDPAHIGKFASVLLLWRVYTSAKSKLPFYPPQMMTGLECNHRFCTHCWTEYLTTKIMEEGLGQTISCAAHGCDILVDDATVMRLVKDSKVRLKYQQIITNSFVQVHCFSARWTRKNLFTILTITGYSRVFSV